MNLRRTLFTLLYVLCIAAGQLLFKKTAATLPDTLFIAALRTNGWLVTSLVPYALTTLGVGAVPCAAASGRTFEALPHQGYRCAYQAMTSFHLRAYT
jgi:hypothetical protein